MDLEQGTFQRLANNLNPFSVWSPDGSEILYNSIVAGLDKLYRVNAEGGNPAQIDLASTEQNFPFDWVGSGMLYSQGGATRRDLMLLSLTPGSTPLALVDDGSFNYGAQVSPDGNWMAYVTNADGRDEVYVDRFPTPTGRASTVSQDGGTMPVWNSDDSELFYAAGGQLMVVDVRNSDEGISFGRPQELFELGASPRFVGASFWWPPAGGQEFLILRNSGGRSIHLTFNWQALLNP